MQHFANNFITKNAADISDFGIKLIDDKNKETEFADGEKKFPIVIFLIEFWAWIELIEKKQKSREEQIKDVVTELEKDSSNFQITIQRKDNTIQEYIRFLK